MLDNETIHQLNQQPEWSFLFDGVDIDYQHKFDALIAAVFEQDDAQRDRILARAKELEAESPDGDDE